MNLLSIQGMGALYSVILFAVCFLSVHGVKLFFVYRALKKSVPPPKEQTETPTQEPVYYIVEKKKKRAKAEYTEPRRIQFK